MSNELVGETDAAQWAHSFVNMFYLVPSEGAMITWFANAIESGRSAGQMPPEWFDKIRLFSDADSNVYISCTECQEMIVVKENHPFTFATLREIIVVATRHRQEKHGSDSD